MPLELHVATIMPQTQAQSTKTDSGEERAASTAQATFREEIFCYVEVLTGTEWQKGNVRASGRATARRSGPFEMIAARAAPDGHGAMM